MTYGEASKMALIDVFKMDQCPNIYKEVLDLDPQYIEVTYNPMKHSALKGVYEFSVYDVHGNNRRLILHLIAEYGMDKLYRDRLKELMQGSAQQSRDARIKDLVVSTFQLYNDPLYHDIVVLDPKLLKVDWICTGTDSHGDDLWTIIISKKISTSSIASRLHEFTIDDDTFQEFRKRYRDINDGLECTMPQEPSPIRQFKEKEKLYTVQISHTLSDGGHFVDARVKVTEDMARTIDFLISTM